MEWVDVRPKRKVFTFQGERRAHEAKNVLDRHQMADFLFRSLKDGGKPFFGQGGRIGRSSGSEVDSQAERKGSVKVLDEQGVFDFRCDVQKKDNLVVGRQWRVDDDF